MTHLASHCAIDVAGHFVGGIQQQAIHRRDIAARHAEARMTKQRLDDQFAKTQFMRRAGVGVAQAVGRIGGANNSSPRLREDGRVRNVESVHAGKDVFALGRNTGQGCLSSLWQGSDGRACLCIAEPQAGICKIDL